MFDPDGGSDEIDGKDGVDTVLIFDQRDNYEITISNSVVSIKALDSATGDYAGNTITLTNIETIIFSDQTVQVSDLTSKSSSSRLVDQKSGDENDSETEPETIDDSDDIIGLPDDEWGNDFDFSVIDLPENTDNYIAEINESTDLWNDLILVEDSMELNFDIFSGDDALAISMVKPIDESYLNNDSIIPLDSINDQVVWEDWNYQSI